jgi:hypothetical protein
MNVVANIENEYQNVVGVSDGKFSFQLVIIKLMHPLKKKFPFYCVSFMFIVVVFVFVLFGVVLSVYGIKCVMLKLCYKNKLALINIGFQFRVVNFEVHQKKTFIIHQCQFVNYILEFFSHYKSKSNGKSN